MKKLGIIGWRGMVGSTLMQRMREENDFQKFETYFFSTSQVGQNAPVEASGSKILLDAFDEKSLTDMDILLTCQGGDYTSEVHSKLRSNGWSGYWIDAASTLRMDKKAVIILDPINKDLIQKALNDNLKDYVGGNCTVSLMLMGLGNLFKENLVEWMTSMSYQAASGAGAKNMQELCQQMKFLGEIYNPSLDALELEKKLREISSSDSFPKESFGAPLASSLIPFIDKEMTSGQSKEEWKAQVEANKILGNINEIPIDGTCVRIGAMRSHSQGFTIKLKKNVELKTIEELIASSTPWTELVKNNKEDTVKKLNPLYTSGNHQVVVGRVRKMTLGSEFVNAFVIGDQLLWGAAEPLRRMLHLI